MQREQDAALLVQMLMGRLKLRDQSPRGSKRRFRLKFSLGRDCGPETAVHVRKLGHGEEKIADLAIIMRVAQRSTSLIRADPNQATDALLEAMASWFR